MKMTREKGLSFEVDEEGFLEDAKVWNELPRGSWLGGKELLI